jgi:biopolymer transport protein ExbD
MRLPRAPRRLSTGMSMTPMIDMSFLLITFFVMSMRLSASARHEVELPRADQAKATHEAHPTIVTLVVDQRGRLFWGERRLDLDTLEHELAVRGEGHPDLKVVLRADARSPFQRVRGVMRAAAQAGIEKISIQALRLEEKGP